MNSSDDEMIVLPVRKYSNDEIENEVDEDLKVDVKVEAEHVSDEEEDELKCDGCGLDFSGKEALRKHQKEKHDLRKFLCKHCGQSFVGNDALRYHERTHQQVTCDMCDKLISSKNFISNHPGSICTVGKKQLLI